MTFEEWFASQKKTFHCGQYTTEEIAHAAWLAGQDTQDTTAKEITLVDGDDWTGIYIDGKLAAEGHSFDKADLLQILNIPYEYKEADPDWMYEVGNLPKNLSDVKCAY